MKKTWRIELFGYENEHDFGTFETGFTSQKQAAARAEEIRREYASADDPLPEEEIRVVAV